MSEAQLPAVTAMDDVASDCENSQQQKRGGKQMDGDITRDVH